MEMCSNCNSDLKKGCKCCSVCGTAALKTLRIKEKDYSLLLEFMNNLSSQFNMEDKCYQCASCKAKSTNNSNKLEHYSGCSLNHFTKLLNQ